MVQVMHCDVELIVVMSQVLGCYVLTRVPKNTYIPCAH